jgi:hypothetical protein
MDGMIKNDPIMYKTMGVYVLIATQLPVANFLTADNNDARKPPSFHTCGRWGFIQKNHYKY